MWNVFVLSQETGASPSDALGLEDPYERYCIDDCVLTWGTYVRSELEKIKHKKEKVAQSLRKARLEELLKDTPTVKRFRNPVATR